MEMTLTLLGFVRENVVLPQLQCIEEMRAQ